MKRHLAHLRLVGPAFVLALAALACALPFGAQEPEALPTFDSSDSPGEDSSAVLGEPYQVLVEGFDHIQVGRPGTYEHYPPSSGEHWSAAGTSPIEPGFYADSLPPEVWVHNLEHGYVVILYNCPEACPELEDQLEVFGQNAPDSSYGYPKLLISPNDQLETLLVALAWGWQLDLDSYDEGALKVFYDRFADNGPEDAP